MLCYAVLCDGVGAPAGLPMGIMTFPMSGSATIGARSVAAHTTLHTPPPIHCSAACSTWLCNNALPDAMRCDAMRCDAMPLLPAGSFVGSHPEALEMIELLRASQVRCAVLCCAALCTALLCCCAVLCVGSQSVSGLPVRAAG